MKKRLAGFLTAVMVLAVLAGCTTGKKAEEKKPETPSTTTTPAPTTPAKPADKQEITQNLGEEPPQMDSARATDTVSFDLLNAIMEGLVRIGEGGKIVPGMAESWDINGADYTFHIRKDAKWSDGKPVTSKDFAYSWFRALDPKLASDYSFILYFIKGAEDYNSLDVKAADYDAKAKDAKAKVAISTPDDNTLKVSLNGPYGFWLGLQSFPTYLPQRQDVVEKFGEKYAAEAANMVFNGPFTMDKWVHEDSVVLKKNANYWDAKTVKLETINLKMIKDSNTAIQLYETGEFDSVGLPGEFIVQYKDKGMKTMAEAVTFYLQLNMKQPHFKSSKLRTAIALSMNRQGFVDNVLKNGSIVPDGLVPPSLPGPDGKSFRDFSGKYLKPAGDPAQAKALWEDAKKELGITKLNLKLLGGDSDVAKKYSAAIKEMIEANLAGITVDIESVAFKVRLEKMKAGDFDFVFAGWGADYNDPMTFMDLFISTGAHNDGKWANAAYDAAIKTAQNSGDAKVRMQAMADAEKILMTELPVMPVYHRAVNWVAKPWYKGYLRFPVGASYEWKWAYVEGKAK